MELYILEISFVFLYAAISARPAMGVEKLLTIILSAIGNFLGPKSLVNVPPVVYAFVLVSSIATNHSPLSLSLWYCAPLSEATFLAVSSS